MLPPETLSPDAPPVPHWRESLFFVAHRRDHPGDVLALTIAHQPSRAVVDCIQLGTAAGRPFFVRYTRRGRPAGTPMAVGPVRIDVPEPYRTLTLRVDPGVSPVGLDLTFTARAPAYLLRPGRLVRDGVEVWRQRHLVQSGRYDGWYEVAGRRWPVDGWWGQRDHSWGVRDHARVPMWLWLAVQLPDGMVGAWCWEQPDGTRCYTDGCWAPAGGTPPVAVTGLRHDLRWLDELGGDVAYGAGGSRVAGLAGRLCFELSTGRRIVVDAVGRWAARYGRRGGGLFQMQVRTDDGRTGTAIYELTGRRHHRYFPRDG